MSALAENRSKGVILRTKEKEIEKGERCTRHFFRKIVNRRDIILKLQKENGDTAETTRTHKERVESFYKEPYKE